MGIGPYIPVHYLYNVHHEIPLGYLIAIYFFYTGLSAGSFLMSALSSVLGIKKFKPIAKVSGVMALTLLAVAPLHLIADLENPMRFWHLFVYYNGSSAISYGTILLTTYPLMTLIYLWFMMRKDFALGAKYLSNWRGKLYRFLALGHLDTSETSFEKDQKIVRTLGMITVPLAFMVHGYTGFILGNVQARGLWNTALMPYIFLMSAIVSGTGLLLLLVLFAERFLSAERRITPERRSLIDDIAKMMPWFILVDSALLISHFIVLYFAGQNAHETAWQMLYGHHQWSFLFDEVFIGLVLPMIIFSVPKLRKNLFMLIIGSFMTLYGVVYMRMNFVVGGQQLELDGNGWKTYIPDPLHVKLIFTFAALEIILLFGLMFLLPITEQRYPSLSQPSKSKNQDIKGTLTMDHS